jgi:hypothetical protein
VSHTHLFSHVVIPVTSMGVYSPMCLTLIYYTCRDSSSLLARTFCDDFQSTTKPALLSTTRPSRVSLLQSTTCLPRATVTFLLSRRSTWSFTAAKLRKCLVHCFASEYESVYEPTKKKFLVFEPQRFVVVENNSFLLPILQFWHLAWSFTGGDAPHLLCPLFSTHTM